MIPYIFYVRYFVLLGIILTIYSIYNMVKYVYYYFTED